MSNYRLEEMQLYIMEKSKVSLDELCEKFEISLSTLRRDLNKLADRGSIRKIYGGVESTKERKLTPLSERIEINRNGKIKIARKAAQFISNNDIIFIDSGSTLGEVAPYLSKNSNLTVITNNMLIINKAICFKNVHLISLSGVYDHNTLSFVGDRVAEILKTYNITKAFMGTTGFSLSSGITNSTPLESAAKRTAIKSATKVFLLADHLKIDVFAPYTYCDYSDIDTLITDKPLPPNFENLFKSNNCNIEVAL